MVNESEPAAKDVFEGVGVGPVAAPPLARENPRQPGPAFERFDGHVVGARDKAREPVFVSSQSEFSILASNERMFESPVETYQRLKHEVRLLTEQLNSASQAVQGDEVLGSSFPDALLSDLKALQMELVGLATDARVGGVLSKVEAPGPVDANEVLSNVQQLADAEADAALPLVCELHYTPQAAPSPSAPSPMQLSQLNQRTSALEKAVGMSAGPPERPLCSVAQSLFERGQLLDQAHTDLLKKRLRALTSQIDTLLQTNKQIGKSAQQDKKVDVLFDIVTKLEAIFADIPAVLARLQSLQRLEQAGRRFESDVAAIQSQQGEIKQMVAQQAGRLDKAEASMSTSFADLLQRFQATQARMDALAKKMADK